MVKLTKRDEKFLRSKRFPKRIKPSNVEYAIYQWIYETGWYETDNTRVAKLSRLRKWLKENGLNEDSEIYQKTFLPVLTTSRNEAETLRRDKRNEKLLKMPDQFDNVKHLRDLATKLSTEEVGNVFGPNITRQKQLDHLVLLYLITFARKNEIKQLKIDDQGQVSNWFKQRGDDPSIKKMPFVSFVDPPVARKLLEKFQSMPGKTQASLIDALNRNISEYKGENEKITIRDLRVFGSELTVRWHKQNKPNASHTELDNVRALTLRHSGKSSTGSVARNHYDRVLKKIICPKCKHEFYV